MYVSEAVPALTRRTNASGCHSRPQRHPGYPSADPLARVWSALVALPCFVGSLGGFLEATSFGSSFHCIIYCLMSRLFSGTLYPRRRARLSPLSLPTSIGVFHRPSVIVIVHLTLDVPVTSMSLFRGCIRALATHGSRLLLFAQVFICPFTLFLSCSCAPVRSPPPSRRSSYSSFMNTLHSLYTVPLMPKTFVCSPRTCTLLLQPLFLARSPGHRQGEGKIDMWAPNLHPRSPAAAHQVVGVM